MAEISAKAVKDLRDQTGVGMMDCKRALADAEGDPKRALELLRERGLAKASKRAGRATSEGAIGMALEEKAGALVELACETDFVARTDDFQGLASALAKRAASDPALDSAAALEGATLDGESVAERVKATIAKIGENVVISRVARVAVDGAGRVGGYVHAGGKLAVLVALRTDATGEGVDAVAKDVAMHVAAADPSPVAADASGVPADVIEQERTLYRRQAEQEGRPEKVLDRIVEGRVRKFLKEVVLLEQPFVKDPDRSVGQYLSDAGKQLGSEIRVAGFTRLRLGEGGGS